jgi:hypothetical protein
MQNLARRGDVRTLSDPPRNNALAIAWNGEWLLMCDPPAELRPQLARASARRCGWFTVRRLCREQWYRQAAEEHPLSDNARRA